MEAGLASPEAGSEEITYENVLLERRVFPRFTRSSREPTGWPPDGPTLAHTSTIMSSALADHCQELVRVLQDDVVRMCDTMLLDEERDSQKCAEYFKRLKDNEDLLTGVLANLTIRMRSCHNALNSKVHLPEAIFNKIMTEVVRETAPRYRLFLGQICSHWRKRVLGTRSLWSAIDLRWKKLSAEYLRRSHPLPIDVDFQPLTFYVPEDVDYLGYLQVLTGHVERLRTLAIQIPQHLLTPSLKTICSHPAPELQSLILKGDEDDIVPEHETDSPPDILNLFQNFTPKLTHINLKHMSISWNSPLFRNLLVLRLEDCPVPLLDSNLLQIISHCPELEALHIGKMRNLTRGILDGPALEDEIKSLPKLHILSLQSLDVHDIRKLLWRMAIPSTTQLSIGCCLDDVHAFRDIFPPLPHHLSNIHSMKSLSISLGPRTLLRGTLYNHGGPMLLTIDLSCVSLEQSAEDQLRNIMSSLPFGNLERLTIVCKQSPREYPPDLAYKVLLSAPTIKYFSVYGVSGEDILRCLGITTATSMSTFDCSDIKFSEADLATWLSRTKKIGLPLTLLEFTRCLGLTDEHILRFRNLVPEVSWDEEGQEFSWPRSVIPTRVSW